MSASTDSLIVSGGVGGIAVNLGDLSALAGRVDRAGRVVADAAAIVRLAASRLLVGSALAPSSGARAVDALRTAAAVLSRVAHELTERASDVRAARTAYADAERRSSAAVAELALRVAGLVVSPWLAEALPLPGRPGVLEPEPALRLVGWASLAITGAAPVAAITQSDRPQALPSRPRGAADLVAGISGLYPADGGIEGSIAVDRIDRPDGGRSWTVLIPGTQSLAVGGRNPMDDATNLQAFTGAPTAVGSAVVAALARAGARPDEPVLLAGHSQGGIVAMRLAANPAVRRRYRVTSVLTAGSPVGHLPTPDGVSSLHLEHTDDVVPMLDARGNPDEPDRVTVRRAGPGNRGAPGNLADAHAVGAYADTAALVDVSEHPSVQDWRARALDVLGGPGATVSRTVYVAERVP